MPDICAVVIGAADVLLSLKRRTTDVNGEVLAFTDVDALRAFDVILKRRPKVVALERVFAATARGVALINRIKADPALSEAEIRVISHDSDFSRVLPRPPGEASPGGTPAPGGTAAASASATVAAPAPALDQRGTRRALRFKIVPPLDITVDGNTASLVDLSTIGAQVISSSVLKPNQRIRVALNDDQGNVRFNASVAWASFEIPPKSGPRYRAGIEFVEADARAVDAFCTRHRQG